jgi:peptidoglycan/LPS O-acetylase OafA/YrhL
MYLYAYPLQQIAVAVLGHDVALVMCAAIVASAGCAWLSWRLVEAPSLRLKPARPMRGASPIERERSLYSLSLRVGPSVPHDERSDSCAGSPRSQP